MSINRQVVPAALGWLLLLLPAAGVAGEPRRFDTGAGGKDSSVQYSAERGHGFETGDPLRFSVRVAEGNYRVTVRHGNPGTAILAERRRLMWEPPTGNGHAFRAGGREVTFVVNVRNERLPVLPANATGGRNVALKPGEIGSPTWDDKLTLQFQTRPESITVDRIPLPTLYLAGDSTVTDQPQAPSGSWGQFITRYLGADIGVANHAESGETLKSFVTELRLDKLLSELRAGDWVMIQFGHNDQKSHWPQTYAEAATTYQSWLRTYLAEIRRRGATPLLVTSPERRNFDQEGRITPSLGEYPDAMRAVALEEKVALLDLNVMSVQFYEALGPTVSPSAFADEGRDKTHHSEYGARQLARAVVEALRSADPALTAGLEKHIAADAGRFDATRPPPPP
jgi:lysophospholipase L1-like esterase